MKIDYQKFKTPIIGLTRILETAEERIKELKDR